MLKLIYRRLARTHLRVVDAHSNKRQRDAALVERVRDASRCERSKDKADDDGPRRGRAHSTNAVETVEAVGTKRASVTDVARCTRVVGETARGGGTRCNINALRAGGAFGTRWNLRPILAIEASNGGDEVSVSFTARAEGAERTGRAVLAVQTVPAGRAFSDKDLVGRAKGCEQFARRVLASDYARTKMKEK